jgi:CubicO group peptidase (beta-lactamase class C family)
MLALIIEKITKLSYKDAMHQIIFRPLGMKNNLCFDYDRDKDSAVTSYKGNKVEIGKTTWMQFMAIKIFILRHEIY